MYPDIQNEPLPNEYQTKQRTETTRDFVDDLFYDLDYKNKVSTHIETALDNNGHDYTDDDFMTVMYDKHNRYYLKKLVSEHVSGIFDDLFAWSDESNSYYEKR